MTWNEFNRLHERYSNSASKIFRIGITRHFEKMLEAAKDNNFSNLDLVITRVDHSDIVNSFTKVYQNAGIIMAFNQFDELEGKKAARRYVVIDGERIDIRAEWLRLLEGIVLDQTIPAMGAVMTTSQELFTEFVERGIAEGMTTSEIAKGLRQRWNELLPWRSFNIARTETLSAMNYGGEIGAQATGVNYKKTWLTAMDGRERKAHGMANGQSVSGREKFWIDGEYMKFPGDPSASPGNRVNCRCTVVREVI